MINYSDFSHQLNGLWPEALAMYGINIPKMVGRNSINHPCPLCGGDDRAHWRDVDGRLSLYCRNCAAEKMKSPEDVIMEATGIEFYDLVKSLADFVHHVPVEVVKKAKVRAKQPSRNLPPDHREDGDLANKILSKCSIDNIGGVDFWRYQNGFYLPICNAYGELINACHFEHGKPMRFIAGGVSFGGFTPVKMNDDDKWLCCTSLTDGRFIANSTGKNVAVCWRDYNMKYVIWSRGDLKMVPVLTPHDDDYLAHEGNHLWLEDWKIEKRGRVE